ncbi:MAG: mannose-6-phosphate isomerase-like protein (cupin superfamily), partial [Reinekea sp.]
MSVIQERVPTGCSEVRHYHTQAEQFFYILTGVASMELEGKIFT